MDTAFDLVVLVVGVDKDCNFLHSFVVVFHMDFPLMVLVDSPWVAVEVDKMVVHLVEVDRMVVLMVRLVVVRREPKLHLLL